MELHCGITLWNYTVELHCGVTLWSYTVELHRCTEYLLVLGAAMTVPGIASLDKIYGKAKILENSVVSVF